MGISAFQGTSETSNLLIFHINDSLWPSYVTSMGSYNIRLSGEEELRFELRDPQCRG